MSVVDDEDEEEGASRVCCLFAFVAFGAACVTSAGFVFVVRCGDALAVSDDCCSDGAT